MNRLNALISSLAIKYQACLFKFTIYMALSVFCIIATSLIFGFPIYFIIAILIAATLFSQKIRHLIEAFFAKWTIMKTILLAGTQALIWLLVMQPEPISDFAGYSNAALAGSFANPSEWLQSKAPAMTVFYGAIGKLLNISSPNLHAIISIILWLLSLFNVLKALQKIKINNKLLSIIGIVLASNPNNIAFSSVVASEWFALAALTGLIWVSAKILINRLLTISDAILISVAVNLVFFTRSYWVLALVPFGLYLIIIIRISSRQCFVLALTIFLTALPLAALKFTTGNFTAQSSGSIVFLFGTNRLTGGGYSHDDLEMLKIKYPGESAKYLSAQARALAWERIGRPLEFAIFFWKQKLPKLFTSYSYWSRAERRSFFQETISKVFIRIGYIYRSIILIACISVLAIVSWPIKNLISDQPEDQLGICQKNFAIIWMWGALLAIAPHFFVEVQGRYSLLFTVLTTAAVATIFGCYRRAYKTKCVQSKQNA
jgi:hypothetical protein